MASEEMKMRPPRACESPQQQLLLSRAESARLLARSCFESTLHANILPLVLLSQRGE